MSESATLIHLISSNKWGGAQQYAFDICSHYNESGITVTAVTRDAKVVDDRFSSRGIDLVHAPLQGFFDPASAIIIARKLKGIPHGKGTIHVHRYRDAFTALLAKRIARRPDIRVVSTRHNVRRGRNTWLFRLIYRKIDAHIFVSQTAFEDFRRSWPESLPMNPERVHILHNSINIASRFPDAEPDKGPVFALYAGPVVKGKGIETIIDALATLRGMKVRLRIAGRGNPDYCDELRRRAMVRGVMEAIDWKTDGDAPDELISQSHFAVLPSVEREGFGLPNLRVMAAGRPQICTTGGAQTEYLTDGETALFVAPADPQNLGDAMRSLAADSSLRTEMGAKAYEYFTDNLSWDKFIGRLSKIYGYES